MLYKDVNLLSCTNDVLKYEEVLSWLFVPHAQHIRTLHIWGGSSDLQDSGAWEECYVNFLLECVNLTTLALYFQHSHLEREWFKLRDMVLTLTPISAAASRFGLKKFTTSWAFSTLPAANLKY
jgi:hypothetical protein